MPFTDRGNVMTNEGHFSLLIISVMNAKSHIQD